MLGNRPMSEWVAQYATSHQHPVNRLCHTFGIPMIVVSILMALAGFFMPSLWIPAAVIFVIGWVLQFIGHYFEGEPPEFFKGLALPVRRVALVARENFRQRLTRVAN